MQNSLTELRKWKLDHKTEDIRGWSLRDPDGQLLGTVDELIVDTDTKHVTQIVLADGKRYAARDVMIGEDELRLQGVSSKVAAERGAAVEAERRRFAAKAEAEAEAERKRLAAGAATTRETPKTDVMRTERDLIVPVIEEQIRVGKREVDAGGMHVESKIVSKPFDQEVRLREEHVTVERRRVDQPLTLADADARLQDGVVELRATAEQAVVEKRARVVEEVTLKKDSTEHVEHVRDSVRHTEVKITEIGNGASKMKKGVKP